MIDKAVPAKIRLNKDLDIEAPVGKLTMVLELHNCDYYLSYDRLSIPLF